MTSEGPGINPVLFNSQLGEGRKNYERDKWKEESNTEEKVDCSCLDLVARGAWRAVISSFRPKPWEPGAEGEEEQRRGEGLGSFAQFCLLTFRASGKLCGWWREHCPGSSLGIEVCTDSSDLLSASFPL